MEQEKNNFNVSIDKEADKKLKRILLVFLVVLLGFGAYYYDNMSVNKEQKISQKVFSYLLHLIIFTKFSLVPTFFE